ncbi:MULTISPECIES: MBOAT family O-acyltransferase [Marinobacter]|uniref:Probable alginate O-acetylase n=1 Tax=Marinobacter profundi TaxID=2666256 RepID=A0A2G1URJ2_9GAMM|nr:MULTISPECIES: MBOAT family protein [Marinobacter]MBD3656650.1 MBOAT family protein [Marinobacter sp.]PHQ17124.1 membrane-bound O-acyltransferase family protein [Marinobacter profundi]
MVFSSNIFLFLFLPAFLGLYYLTPFRHRSWVILIGSYAFYAWWRVDFVLLFFAVTLWNYLIGLGIHRAGTGTALARKWVAVGVAGDLATLGYFKYANFGVDSLNSLLVSAGSQPLELAHIILPIGISFYIFQAISYVVDVYRGDTEPTRRFVDFAAFIALFPQLIAGPVLRYKDLADQFAYRTHTMEKFGEGAVRFMQGFVKKVFIADSIAPLADNAFALADPTTADAWLGALAYTAQLYFDFSGYSDMAIGLGLMMGFRFNENFNQPYVSQSITEFWRRWHISLSSWLRDYLYVPLGGNRKGTFKTYRNLMLTMLLGGLWHGANWTFLLWGAWHGGILAIERWLGVSANPQGFRVLRWALTLLLVVIGWVTFRASSIGEAFAFYQAMFTLDGSGLSAAYLQGIRDLNIAILVLAYGVIAAMGLRDRLHQQGIRVTGPGWRSVAAPLLVPVFALAVLKLSAESFSPFLYFQF